eukprot:1379611-Amorphochlora_amoeboformis.AAC.1
MKRRPGELGGCPCLDWENRFRRERVEGGGRERKKKGEGGEGEIERREWEGGENWPRKGYESPPK